MTTRKAIKAFMLLLALMPMALFTSCATTDDGDYVAPIQLYERVGGNWSLTRLKQVDEVAAAAKQGTTEMDLTGYFANFRLTLNRDDQNRPTTFSATGAPALIPESGYWQLDRPFQNWDGTPVNVLFYSDQALTQQTGQIALTSVPGGSATMELTLSRQTNGSPFVSYVYTLIPE